MPFSRGRSLAVKIPLLTSVLVLAALAAMSVASYVELRSALVDMARGRLEQAAGQMANVFGLSARQRIAAMKQLMQLPELHDFLRSGDASRSPAIEAAVRTYLGPAIEFANVELWDVNGKRVFAVGAPFEELTPPLLEEYKQELQPLDAAAIGRLRQFSDGLRYPVGGRVSQDGQVVGYVVERRSISNPTQTRQTIAMLTGLIGNQATMVIGNADGTMWSDLSTTLEDLPIVASGENRLWDYQRAGMPRAFASATADCLDAMGGGDRVSRRRRARAVEAIRASLAGDCRRGAAVCDHRRMGEHARHHHLVAPRDGSRRSRGRVAPACARRHGS